MKDQALVQNEYVDFFYEQVELEKKLEGRELELARRFNLIGTFPGIRDIKKEFPGTIITNKFEFGYLFTIANVESEGYMSPHAGIEVITNKIFGYKNIEEPLNILKMGISFILVKDTERNDKLVALLDKPRQTDGAYNSAEDEFYILHKNILIDYGVDMALMLKSNDKNLESSSNITLKEADKIINFYTLEVIL